MSVTISGIDKDSISEKFGIQTKDILVDINGNEINDMMDLQFYSSNIDFTVNLLRDNKPVSIDIKKKDVYDSLGLEFETYLIDKHHSCKNKCIFCFIDQLPKGMRPSLYFKDDDERLSFLFGNYITLTNLSQREIDRIKLMKISPINISVHTTNPELRVKMMKNPSSAKINEIMHGFADAGITMNTQIVLCKGVNDEEYLKETIDKLQSLYPAVQSVAIVPIGVTRYREKLEILQTFDKQASLRVINQVEEWTREFNKKNGTRMVYVSDEFFIRAEEDIPPTEYYGDFSQMDNGIGMVRNTIDNFLDELEYTTTPENIINGDIAVGMAHFGVTSNLIAQLKAKYPEKINIKVHGIENDFFGGNVWVTGLLTVTDLQKQLKGKLVSDTLYLCDNMLRSEGDLFLDDKTPEDLEKALNIKTVFYKGDGFDLVDKLFNIDF